MIICNMALAYVHKRYFTSNIINYKQINYMFIANIVNIYPCGGGLFVIY